MLIRAIDPGRVSGVADAQDKTVLGAAPITLVIPRNALHGRPVLAAKGRGTIMSRGNALILAGFAFGREIQRRWAIIPSCHADLAVGELPLLTSARPVNAAADVVVRGNDLIVTAIRLGVLAEACTPNVVRLVHPGTWKGQVPKAIHNRRVLAKLTPAERANVSLDPNAVDALGLLLWALER